VLREAFRRVLRLPADATITNAMLSTSHARISPRRATQSAHHCLTPLPHTTASHHRLAPPLRTTASHHVHTLRDWPCSQPSCARPSASSCSTPLCSIPLLPSGATSTRHRHARPTPSARTTLSRRGSRTRATCTTTQSVAAERATRRPRCTATRSPCCATSRTSAAARGLPTALPTTCHTTTPPGLAPEGAKQHTSSRRGPAASARAAPLGLAPEHGGNRVVSRPGPPHGDDRAGDLPVRGARDSRESECLSL
jgi:hypothetical protein